MGTGKGDRRPAARELAELLTRRAEVTRRLDQATGEADRMNPRDPAQLDHYEELACSLIAYRRELATIEAGLIEAQRAAYEERTAAERKTIVDGDKYAELAQRFRLGAVSAEEALRTAARDPAIEAEAERLRASLSKMGVFVTIERARELAAERLGRPAERE